MEPRRRLDRPDQDPRPGTPLDAPDPDVAEQQQPWDEHEDEDEPQGKSDTLPPDAPEADYLDQHRPAGLEDDDRDR